jgi:predicted transposase/invertase (TIGR01784 family)
MKPDIPNPHDRFFKQVFSQKQNALDFMIHYLPSEILSLVNLDSVEIAKDSFVDEELRESFSDIHAMCDFWQQNLPFMGKI